MGRIIKKISIFQIIIIIIAVFISILLFKNISNNDKWEYKLPNNYKLIKYEEIKTKVGLEKNKELVTKDIGVDIYVAEFQYSKNYIGLKCVDKENQNLVIMFFIIDTLNKEKYGPYFDEETYKEVSKKLLGEEKFNDFISTLKKPNR